jgi:hypothetical protein
VLAGPSEPATFPTGLKMLGEWYRSQGTEADMLVECNDHARAVLLALREAALTTVIYGVEFVRTY